jgi:hypothetical protein
MKTNQLITIGIFVIIVLNTIVVLQNAGIIRPVRESTVSVSKISQEIETKITSSTIDVNLSSIAGHDLAATPFGANIGFPGPSRTIIPINWGSFSITH